MNGTAGHSHDFHPCHVCHANILDIDKMSGYNGGMYLLRIKQTLMLSV
jgi:hypothetical protein